MSRIEQQILSNLIHNEEFCRKTAPFIDPSYFADRHDLLIAREILKFFADYNKLPTQQAVVIEMSNRKDITDKELAECQSIVQHQLVDREPNVEWLIDRTERFCKSRAVYNAILDSIKIIDGKDTKHTQEAIPKLLQDALAVSFDTRTGHDYLLDADSRYEFYHRREDKLPFDIDLLNEITAGGLTRKSLNCAIAMTGGGKSLFMCHVAAATLLQSKSVLYLTMEMSEERIAERIDANLLNLSMDELKVVDKPTFDRRMSKLSSKTQGRLIIKEYPTASAHSGHFRALLEELKIKRDFVPDLVVIDYLNICASARMRMGGSVNSYTYIKSIAEELRGLAVEYNVPILTATQTNRQGYDNSDIDLSNVSESSGLSSTCDLMLAIIRSEELDQLNQIMIKQLKNRYADPSRYNKFVVGVDRSKMKLYNCETSAQAGLSDAGQDDYPVFDKSSFGQRSKVEGFGDFKF
jgi:replicative DNA helicase